jgi:hypothetical protein
MLHEHHVMYSVRSWNVLPVDTGALLYPIFFVRIQVVSVTASTGSMSRHFGYVTCTSCISVWQMTAGLHFEPPSAHRGIRKECGTVGGGTRQELFCNHAAVLSVCANVACGAEVAWDPSSPVAAPTKQVRKLYVTHRYLWTDWSATVNKTVGRLNRICASYNDSSWKNLYFTVV